MRKREKQLMVFAKWLQDHTYNRRYEHGKLESEIGYAIEESTNKIGEYLQEILEMDDEQLDKEI